MIEADSDLPLGDVRSWIETLDRGEVVFYLEKGVGEAIKAYRGQVGGFLPHGTVV